MVTLHHFTMPKWLREKGGWEWKGAPAAFERFAAHIYRHIGARVTDWITINEPMVHVVAGYLAGVVPPGKQNLDDLGRAVLGMLRSHAAVYHRLHADAKQAGRPIRVGFAHHLRVFSPRGHLNPLDQLGAKLLDQAFNWAFIDAVESGRFRVRIPLAIHLDETIPRLGGTQDFLGVNYYTRDLVKVNFQPPIYMEILPNSKSELTDLNWEIYPWGFRKLLLSAHRRYPRRPIVITENGLADSRDAKRVSFLKRHLGVIHELIQKGVRIEGYFHWSLMDNFEWIEGFEPRFGLYSIDYDTFERTPRESARWYKELIRRNGFQQ